MSDASASPPRRPSVRIGGPRGFLPLVSDDALSTRGQTLPGLLRDRSTTSLRNLAHGIPRRRTSMIDGDDNDEEAGARSIQYASSFEGAERDGRRVSIGGQVLMTPQMRSMRLIGSSNPRYQWQKYWKSEEELKHMKKPIRQYYERTNSLVQQYLYIDKLLDSSLPHSLLQEYEDEPSVHIPPTIREEASQALKSKPESIIIANSLVGNGHGSKSKVKRTPKALYKVPQEDTPLLSREDDDDLSLHDGPRIQDANSYEEEEEASSGSAVVKVAIYINLIANTILLAAKIAVIILTSSLSVLASLVDAALDFLSTAIVWITTRLIQHQDQYAYPVGRRRLEPIGVLVFSVIMITSFFQVLLECFNRLTSGNHALVQLGIPAIVIMASTVVIKFLCWLWCRLIKNSSVQALAQDAMTDVVFNTFSIIFPLVGFYVKLWWLDALGGIILSLYVIVNWARTSSTHIRNLTGAAASADERNVLLYLTMRFAKTIKQIQGLQAYHAGDKLNVEVDVVLDEGTRLRDSHDLGESLQYVLESVPYVDRAFVHLDYAGWNLPTHMDQHD